VIRWAYDQARHCDGIYAIGLTSLYLWTGQNAPNGLNTNDPFGLLSNAQQARSIADMSARMPQCVLIDFAIINRFDRGQLARSPPLLSFIQHHYHEAGREEYVELLRR
jgi:hypothetical protein